MGGWRCWEMGSDWVGGDVVRRWVEEVEMSWWLVTL